MKTQVDAMDMMKTVVELLELQAETAERNNKQSNTRREQKQRNTRIMSTHQQIIIIAGNLG